MVPDGLCPTHGFVCGVICDDDPDEPMRLCVHCGDRLLTHGTFRIVER